MVLVCTFYDGETRKYGYFHCEQCGRLWESANSWEKRGQICRDCDAIVYPFILMPLDKKLFTDDFVLSHPHDKCEMCMELNPSIQPNPFTTYIN